MTPRTRAVPACVAAAALLAGCASAPREAASSAAPYHASARPARPAAAWAIAQSAPGAAADGIGTGPAAPPPADGADGWKWSLAPYVWLFDIDGDIAGKGGRTVPVSAHLSDAIDLVKDHFEFGFAAHLEARQGDWSVFLDGDYLAFGTESSASRSVLQGLATTSADLDIDLDLSLVELGVARRVWDVPVGGGAAPVEILGGVRWNRMSFDASLERTTTGPRQQFERDFDADFTTDWLDPFIGVRSVVPLGEDVGLLVRADIGGGVGSGADVACNVILGLAIRCGETTDAFAGYRWYSWERDSGGRDTDLEMEGPGIGVTFRF